MENDMTAKTQKPQESGTGDPLTSDAPPLTEHDKAATALAASVDQVEGANAETEERQRQNLRSLGGPIAPGTDLVYNKGEHTFPARVIAYHAAIPANEEIGLEARGAMVDLHVETGDPATGGRVRVEGIPVSEVSLG